MSWLTPKTDWTPVDGVLNTDLKRIEENIRVLESTGNSIPTTTGTIPNYIVNIPDFIGLTPGRKITVKFHIANGTVASTLNPNSTGELSIIKAGGGNPNIKAGVYTLVYTGTNFQLLGEGGEYGNATPDKVVNGTTFGTENGVQTGTFDGRIINNQVDVLMEYAESIAINDPVAIKYKSTKLANPATVPVYGYAMAWSQDGMYYVSGSGSSSTYLYKRSGDSLIKLADPSTGNIGYLYDAKWSEDGQYLVCAVLNDPYIAVYRRDGDVFTKLATPAITPPSSPKSIAISPDNKYIAIGSSGSTWVYFYKMVNDVITTIGNDSTPAAPVTTIEFTDNNHLLYGAFSSSPGFAGQYSITNDVPAFVNNILTGLNNGVAVRLAISSDGLYAYIPNGTTVVNIVVLKRTSLSATDWVTVSTEGFKDPKLSAIKSFSMSENGLAIGGDTGSYTYDMVMLFRAHDSDVTKIDSPIVYGLGREPYAMAISPDDTYVAIQTNYSTTGMWEWHKLTPQAVKSKGSVAELLGKVGAGYAKEAGTIGQTKIITKIWG